MASSQVLPILLWPSYHSYNFDFRGRVYVNTAFLHEQSSDNAKGLLLLNDAVPLGENGLYWLKIHTSNCFGNDKVTLKQRAEFIDEHLDLFLSYAEKPTINQGWIEAEAPFSFLAACNELKKIKVNEKFMDVVTAVAISMGLLALVLHGLDALFY